MEIKYAYKVLTKDKTKILREHSSKYGTSTALSTEIDKAKYFKSESDARDSLVSYISKQKKLAITDFDIIKVKITYEDIETVEAMPKEICLSNMAYGKQILTSDDIDDITTIIKDKYHIDMISFDMEIITRPGSLIQTLIKNIRYKTS